MSPGIKKFILNEKFHSPITLSYVCLILFDSNISSLLYVSFLFFIFAGFNKCYGGLSHDI